MVGALQGGIEALVDFASAGVAVRVFAAQLAGHVEQMERYLRTSFGYAIVVPVPPLRGSEVQRIDLAYNVGAVQNQGVLLVDRAALEGLVQLSIARVFFVPQEAAGTGQLGLDVLRRDAQLGA